MDDPYDLARFVAAQDPVFERVCAELQAGRKTSHWMWFVFPQLAGLGSSPMARRYALSGRAEAEAYLAHELLDERLRMCIGLLLHLQGRTAHQVFGDPDTAKFRSSLTLFAAACPAGSVFERAIDRFFDGEGDAVTMRLLSGG